MTLFDRDTLLREISSFFADRDADARDEIARRVALEVDRAGVPSLVRLGRRLSSSGDDWDFYPADPLARSIHLSLADILLDERSALQGLAHAAAAASGPLVIFANHLS